MYRQTGGGATSYLAFYFWFHMSLFYWLKIYRNQFPHVKYLWRIEPDVLFSGDISQARDTISDDLRTARCVIPARSLRRGIADPVAISARSRRDLGVDAAQMLARSWHKEADVLLPFAMSKVIK